MYSRAELLMKIIRDIEGRYVAYINGERERTPAFDNIEDCAAYAEEHDEEMRRMKDEHIKSSERLH